jgi:hypothetical protein
MKIDIEQGSEVWHMVRAHLVTASVAKTLEVNGKSKFGLGVGALTKAHEKLAYMETGYRQDISAHSLEHGHTWEDFARAAYSRMRMRNVQTTGIIVKENVGGYSPDGLIDGENGGVEFKCPFSVKVFYEIREKISAPDDAYISQCKFGCLVADLDFIDLMYFSPYFEEGKNTFMVRVMRDPIYEAMMLPKLANFYKYMSELKGSDIWDSLRYLISNIK